MEALLTFILKYWLEFVLGGIAVFITAKYKQLKKRYDVGKQQEEAEALEPFKVQIQEFKDQVLTTISQKEQEFEMEEKHLDEEMKDLHQELVASQKEIYHILEKSREVSQGYRDLYQEGLLYNMRKDYFKDCKTLLDPEHVITFEEFSLIATDHNLYNRLGGNHQGDIYFQAIEDKYHNQTH